MAYASWSVVFGEQPSTAKWNILGTNDASFANGTGIASLATNTTAISNPYKFSVYRNAAQNLSAGVGTKINYDTELFDTNNNFDSTTNRRYTAPVAGFYQINMICQVTATTTDTFYPYIYKNGTTEVIRGARRNAASTLLGLGLSGIIQLAASDYIEAFMFNSGASTPALEVATIYTNAFNGYLISQT